MIEEVEEIREPFTQWLTARWPERSALRLRGLESPKSGFSAQTLILPIEFEEGGESIHG